LVSANGTCRFWAGRCTLVFCHLQKSRHLAWN
jgi:hypothetical protein